MKRDHLSTSRLFAAACLMAVCGVLAAMPVLAQADYLGPTVVVASKDAKSLYVANTYGGNVAVVNVADGKVTRTIDMPASPTGMITSPDGATLYVTCAAPEGTVCVVDLATSKITAEIPVGHSPMGPSITPDGKALLVCNRFEDNVSVVVLGNENREMAKVPVLREPVASVITPDGKSAFVLNHLSVDPADGYDVAIEVSVFDLEARKASSIRLPNGCADGRDICVSPDGKYVYCTHILARYQMPTTQLERGWMNTNALSVIDAEKRELLNTVLLDDVDLGAANPWGVACSPDGKSVCVGHAGTHEISVIDAPALIEKLRAMPSDKDDGTGTGSDDQGAYASATAADVPNDLAFLVGLRRRIRLQGSDPWAVSADDATKVNGPRGLTVIGSTAYAACYFSDNLAVVDLEPKLSNQVKLLPLGPKPEMSIQRRGEMLFNDAALCFQHWQSCASCHPDSRVDALNWDLMNDGLGNPKNVKSMLLAHKTPPAMISGIRGSAEVAVRAGITHIQFAVRPEEDAVAIDEYLKAMKPVPSPHLVDGKLSEAAQRGKKIFNDEEVGCVKCHPAPLYTDLTMHDVGSRGEFDRRDTFDTPTLVEVWRTAPYMHDGKYVTMKDLFTKGKHGQKGGDIEKLSEGQLNDLIEFVLSL